MKFIPPIFIVTLFVPLRLDIATVSIYPSRLLLVVVFLPLLLRWLRSRDLSGRFADSLVITHALWGALAIAVVHGFDRIQAIGIYPIEVIGCYLIGRMTVRDADTFQRICRLLFTLTALTIPLAVIEALTNRNIILDLLGPYGVDRVYAGMRLGFHRAQVLFAHAILFGIVTGGSLSLAYYVVAYKKPPPLRVLAAMVPMVAGFFSLSSAALSVMTSQMALIAWDKVTGRTRNKWLILGLLFVIAYVVVDILSNRTPVEVFASYFTLSRGTAYTRIYQWDYSIDDVMRNWVFGIGFNSWDRPFWLVGSIDNFWLATALRYGVPTVVLLLVAVVLIVKEVMSWEVVDERTRQFRTGYFVLIVTFAFAAVTVHLWSETFYLFMFFLGCRTWIGAEVGVAEKASSAPERPMGYTRELPVAAGVRLESGGLHTAAAGGRGARAGPEFIGRAGVLPGRQAASPPAPRGSPKLTG